MTSPSEDYRLIPLTRGQFAKVDIADFDALSRYKWYAKLFNHGSFYAARTDRSSGTVKTVLMHRQILGLSEKTAKGDHINRDTLDYRRSNLRECSNAENCRNKGAHKNNKLGLKGVTHHPCHNRIKHYRAAIMLNGKRIGLGMFLTKEEAAQAYDEAAKEHHGQFAVLNSTTS